MLTFSSTGHSLYEFKYGLANQKGLPRQYLFCGSFVFLCLVFLMLSRLFIAALWSPAGKGLNSRLKKIVGDVYCIFVTLLFGILGQVWYLIVSFPDVCCLSYFSFSESVWQPWEGRHH